MSEACCTCATLLSNITPLYDEKTEKPKAVDRRLECCNRMICGRCIYNNPGFATYCVFCQISTTPSSLPQGLRNPPPYTPPSPADDLLPSYSSLVHPTIPSPAQQPSPPPSEKSQQAQDVLHFLNHAHDTLTSLSFRYNVPLAALRRANGLTSDHLLLARRTVIIPGEFYKGGVSLSPRPIEGEEEELRKGKVRRWMVGCKVAEYDVALLYLKQADYDLEAAIEAYKDDEKWEKEHPLEKEKGKMKYDLGKRCFTGQRS